MIHRHNRCLGIVLFRWGNRQLEVWFCPRDDDIEPHVHAHIDSTIIFLWGSMLGMIGQRYGWLDWRDIGRRWYIPAGVEHSARVHRFSVFANWERWHAPVTSAARDFTAV